MHRQKMPQIKVNCHKIGLKMIEFAKLLEHANKLPNKNDAKIQASKASISFDIKESKQLMISYRI